MARRTGGSAPRSRRGSRCPARARCSSRSPRCPTRERALVHTHASEQRDEVELVRAANRHRQHRVPPAGRSADAPAERRALRVGRARGAGDAGGARRQGHALPRIEPQARLRHRAVPRCWLAAICVSLGSDGAACNNHLDMFGEMRLAATLQAARREPGALPARQALWMATRNGARALGLEDEIGSVEVGKRADLILVGRDAAARGTRSRTRSRPSSTPHRPSDVRMTMVDGEVLVRDGVSLRLDAARRGRRGAARGACPGRAGRTIIDVEPLSF